MEDKYKLHITKHDGYEAIDYKEYEEIIKYWLEKSNPDMFKLDLGQISHADNGRFGICLTNFGWTRQEFVSLDGERYNSNDFYHPYVKGDDIIHFYRKGYNTLLEKITK